MGTLMTVILLLALGMACLFVLILRRQGSAFADRPSLDECERLVRDYLTKRRHMEAMVVAKKAVKVDAEGPRGKVLLAEVYIAQGKTTQARRLLAGVLELFPNDHDAARLMRFVGGDGETDGQ